MKRILAFVLAVTFVFTLTGCGAGREKKDIFDLVEKNYEKILAACEQKDVDALLAIDGIQKARIDDGYVLVYCKGAGIVPSSQDYGFYYSENNSPVTVHFDLSIVCYAEDLTPEGKGYGCVVNYNEFYTEQIKGNIWFFSTAY